jgi:hypothetical protein
MKKLKFWSMLLLAVMVLPLTVACSDDDEEEEEIDYTSSEIVDLLLGGWDVHGSLKVTSNDKNFETVSDNFKGTIEFKKSSNGYQSFNFTITENDLDIKPEGRFIWLSSPKGCFMITKRQGHPYVHFGCDGDYDDAGLFKIVSLSKSKFKMVLDVDYYDYYNLYDKIERHAYMTLISE